MRLLPLVVLLAACPEPEPGDGAVDLAAAIDAQVLMEHLEALEQIAADNDNTRVYVSSGYDSSVDYIARKLEDAGYVVTYDTFEIRVTDVDATVELVDEGGNVALEFEAFRHTGEGAAQAQVTAVDVTIPPGADNTSTSGCDASDFDGFPSGHIALIQRGSCQFAEKASRAEDAGASGVIIFNEGQDGRQGVVDGTLDADDVPGIPVVGVSYQTGVDLADGAVVSMDVSTSTEILEDTNVIAETPGGDPNRVLMLGAHLDSVRAGPGINDNGSGSAFVLEVALQVAEQGMEPANKMRFAWWGAEEQGLIGSQRYFFDDAGDPDEAVLATLDAYLNFDMLASGNGSRFVYDGDGSHFTDGFDSPANAVIEQLFLDHFDENNQPTWATGLAIGTDSFWTAVLGVPTGGLFSGAWGVKRADEAEVFGGDVGEWRDPCYHQACDLVENTDPVLYEELAKAGAVVTQALAMREEPLPGPARRAPRDTPMPSGCHGHIVLDR